jgi:hypothetical protein
MIHYPWTSKNKLNLPERSSGVHLADPAVKMRAPFPCPAAEPTASITTATAMSISATACRMCWPRPPIC